MAAREIGGRFLDDQPVKGVYGQAGYAACSALKQDVLRVHAAVDGLFRLPLVYVYCSISSRVGALERVIAASRAASTPKYHST
jgi:hypothetical protein